MFAPSPRRRAARLTVVFCGVTALIIGCTSGSPDSQDGSASSPTGPSGHGAAGAGDEYYPNDGNGGYDALDYAVSLRYDPAQKGIDAETTVTAKARKSLSRFNLDLRGLRVESVSVNGEPATFTRSGEFELVITPAEPLAEGQTFHTRVAYHGVPERGNDEIGANGWVRDETGAMYVLGQPHSASFWYPVNDTPKDKARFHLEATVPREWSAVSIGRLESKNSEEGWASWRWDEQTPVAPYLTMLAVDKFTIDRGTLDDGTPILSAYAPGARGMRSKGSRIDEVLTFLESKFGPYPQRAAGGIFLDKYIGFSLETQTRPTFSSSVDMRTIVHELAHQWYGDSVTVDSWADVCLNECFASYAMWMWAAHEQGKDLDAMYRNAVRRLRDEDEVWESTLYDMGAGNEFSAVYSTGRLAIHALRRRIGEDAFSKVLREWPEEHKNGNASWPEFERFVTEAVDENLDPFFAAWFHETGIPDDKYLYPGSLGG